MKKMTEEQEEAWNRVEKAISNWFWGVVAVALIVWSAVYVPWVG